MLSASEKKFFLERFWQSLKRLVSSRKSAPKLFGKVLTITISLEKKCPYSEDRRDSNLKKSREKCGSVATYWKGTFQKGTMAFGKNDIRFSANRVLWHTFSYATTRRFAKIHTADLYLQNNRITHTSVPADLWCPARKKCFKKPLLHIQPPEQKGRHQKRYVQV